MKTKRFCFAVLLAFAVLFPTLGETAPPVSKKLDQLAFAAPLKFEDLLASPAAIRRSRLRNRGAAMSSIADLTPPYSSSHAIEFGGTNETVAFAHIDTANASRVTWSFWIHNAATVADEEIMSQYGSGGGSFHWSLRSTSGRVAQIFPVAADCTSGSSGTANVAYSAADFVHICWEYDGSQASNATRMTYWADGTQQTVTFSGTIPAALCNNANTQAFYLGSFEGASNFAAFILDEAAIWIGGTPPTCTQIYNARTLLDLSAQSPAPVWCSNFNGDTLPTVVDQCGSNDGTAANMEAGDIQSLDVAP